MKSRILLVLLLAISCIAASPQANAEKTAKCGASANATGNDLGAISNCPGSKAPSAPGGKKKAAEGGAPFVGTWTEMTPGCNTPGNTDNWNTQTQAGAAGANTGCNITDCPQGQQAFTRTTFERTDTNSAANATNFQNAGCQGSAPTGPNVDELAVTEFFHTKIEVDAPGIQPDTGTLFVNMPNNFYCTTPKQTEIDSSITINGGVRFRLTVDEILLDYGASNKDGSVTHNDRYHRTSNRGARIDDTTLDRIHTREQLAKASQISHEYWQTGTYNITITVYFAGEYSVGGGPWQPINGTIYATSQQITVTVYQTRAELIQPTQ